MTHLIKVTNRGDIEIIEYFHGDAYKFLPDRPVNVPLEAMRHIFGVDFPADEEMLNSASFRDQVFASVSRRWGWGSHDKKLEAVNRKKLNDLKFTPVIMKMVELIAQEETLDEPREEKKSNRPGKYKAAPAAESAVDPDEEEVA